MPSPSPSEQPTVTDASTAGEAVDGGTGSIESLLALGAPPPDGGGLLALIRDEQPTPPRRDGGLPNVTVTMALPPAPQMADAETLLRVNVVPRARLCYERGIELAGDSPRGGEITLRVAVTATGEVENVASTAIKGLSAQTVGCIAAGARRLQFTAPADGNPATLQPKLTLKVLGH